MIKITTDTNSFSIDNGIESKPFQKNTVNVDYDINKNSITLYVNNDFKDDVLGPYNLSSVSVNGTVLTTANVYNQLDKLYK